MRSETALRQSIRAELSRCEAQLALIVAELDARLTTATAIKQENKRLVVFLYKERCVYEFAVRLLRHLLR